MENLEIKEKLNVIKKEIIKNLEKLSKLNIEEKKQHDLYFENKINDEEYKKFALKSNKAIKCNQIEEKILINNYRILIYNICKNEIAEILKKYDNKKIGEITKKKIEDEIKIFLMNKYKIDCYVYFKNKSDYLFNSKNYKYIDITTCYGFFKNYYSIKFEYEEYEDSDGIIRDINKLGEFEYKENYKQHAKKIYNEYIKIKNIYNKKIEELEKLKKEYNEKYIKGALFDIKKSIYIDSNNYDIKRLY